MPQRVHQQAPCASLDHLVGTGEEGGRDVQTQGPCRLDVDHEFELRRLNHRQLLRFLALQNPPYVNTCLTIRFGLYRAVAHQTASIRKYPLLVNGWDTVPRREQNYLVTTAVKKR